MLLLSCCYRCIVPMKSSGWVCYSQGRLRRDENRSSRCTSYSQSTMDKALMSGPGEDGGFYGRMGRRVICAWLLSWFVWSVHYWVWSLSLYLSSNTNGFYLSLYAKVPLLYLCLSLFPSKNDHLVIHCKPTNHIPAALENAEVKMLSL